MRRLLFLLLATSLVLSARSARSQCTFTSTTAGGNWNSPSTWIRTGTGCSVFTTPFGGSMVIINGPVTLNTNFSSTGSVGRITINAGGSLTEDATPRTLTIGNSTGGYVANRLVIAAGGSLDVSTITFIKSGATISGGFYTRCNLSVDNQTDLTINTDAIINGNLLVQPGNPTLRGAGTLLVRGCCAGSVGAINGLNQAPATLSVCIQDNAANRDACGTAGQTCSSSLPTSLQGCSSFTVLPVELAAFSARYAPEQASVWLHWLTASEENNDRFEIQRSPDGRTFHTLARVAGHGTTLTPHEYRWSDTRPLPGLSYYRLRQVDADGKAAFSEVITATAAAEPTAQVWPSEISGHYHVRVAQPTDAAALLQVFSPLGRLVRSASLRTTDPQELSLQDLPAGTYTLRIVTGSQVFTHRLLHPQP